MALPPPQLVIIMQQTQAQKQTLGAPLKDCSVRLNVNISKSDVQKILNKGDKIPPSAIVYHGCQTFPEVEPFEFKWCKKVIGFPCRNMPVLCHACTTDPNIPTFLWSYNIENHYKEHHSVFSDDDRV